MPRRSGKFERCARKVRAHDGRIRSPDAVCAQNLRRAGWTPGRNPVEDWRYRAAAALDATHSVGERGPKTYNARQRIAEWLDREQGRAPKADIRWLEELARRSNPARAAAELAEAFHGRPVQERVDLDEAIHYHAHLAGLGELEEIELEDGTRLDGFQGALLASNEDGTQLFITGGDQQVSLDRFDVDPSKERVLLGRVGRIVYVTAKYHLGRQDRKRGPYEHELGEESGELPWLEYDVVNRRLSFVGGAYQVEPEGVVN